MKKNKWFDVELMLNIIGSVFVAIAVYSAIAYFVG